MKISPVLQILSVWLLVAILGAAFTMTRASAADIDDPVLSGKAAKTDDPVMTTLSTSQCAAGYFCVWSQPNYVGTIQRFSAQSQYKSIVIGSVGSFYNNRGTRVFVYGDPSGSPSACYGARVKKASTSSWIPSAEGTYLSTAASC